MNLQQNGAAATVESDTFGMNVPLWLLRWKLNWVQADIDQLERLLDDEFGVVETAPMHEQHEALTSERDALMQRLTTPMKVFVG